MLTSDRARREPFALGFLLSAITVAFHAFAAVVVTFGGGRTADSFAAVTFLLTVFGIAFELRGLVRAYQHRSCPTGVGVLAIFCLIATLVSNLFVVLVLPLTIFIVACTINGSVYVASDEDDG